MKWIISACALFLAWSGQCQGGFTFRDHAWVGQQLAVTVAQALTNGAVAHWRLDEASNLSRTDSISGLVLVDSLSDTPSATGLITNAAGPFSTSGQLTNADNATISLGTNTDFTLLAWVKTPAPLFGGYATILEKGSDATSIGNEYWIQWYGGGTNFVFVVGTTDAFQQIVGDAPVSTNQWHHLAGRYSSAAQKIYWNMDVTNELSTNWTGGTFDSPDALTIGNSLNTGQPWTNLIDEVTIFKRFLSSNEVYRVYTNEKAGISYPWVASTPASTNLLTSLVAYWKMDEQITSGTRADSHTNAFDLSDNNNNTISNNAAVLGYSAQFAGSAGSCLRHADDAGLKLGADTSFAISLWIITADTFPFPGVLVDKGSAFDLTHDEFLIYYIASGQMRFGVGNGTTYTNIDAATTLSTFTTNHIVACYSAAEQKLHLYINGTEDGASPVTWTGGTFGTAGPLSFGEASSTTGFAITGNIDEVGYWHRALTASEVTALYNSGAGLAFSNFGSTP